MKYTTSKEADKKIEKDTEIIKKIILRELSPKAIIFFGGFGHGEGSFIKNGKKITSLNDYDLYIITKNKIDNKKLEDLGRECSYALGRGGLEFVEEFNQIYDENNFFHVDLHSIAEKNLSKLYDTQRTFDLKTSLVIYGDKNILNRIPNVRIPKSDALRILFNKINHLTLAEGNAKKIKSIYAIKGFTDLCSALLIFYGKYSSKFQDKEKDFLALNVPDELKRCVSKAIKAKLYGGYDVEEVETFFNLSKKWVIWTLKKILKEYVHIDEADLSGICREAYIKLPYVYFNDYLKSKFLFPAQYYLNIRFFLEGIRKGEFLIKSLLRWRDAGLIIALAMILYSVDEKKEAEKYLKKLTNNTSPLRDRILKLYSIYYLQKLI
ncbi:hypothetical protein M0R19_07155 [Candidatus Pacearchaeota archaeon]|jgi:hypothetical protein|nr:hypothetical protein [Candidatus Pacearchaeota archaeon]